MWEAINKVVLDKPAHEAVCVEKHSMLEPPESAGFRISFGAPQGQLRDFRKSLPDGRCIHVREFPERYCVHWDWRDPGVDPIGHLVRDAPSWLFLIAALSILYLLKELAARSSMAYQA